MDKRKMKELIIKAKERSLNLKDDMEKAFKVRDAKDKKIFYSVLGVVVVILIYVIFIRGYFISQEQKKMAGERAKQEQIRQERIEKVENAPKSRISFFLANPVRANLAIPDYWEGNYRLSESNGKASFVYIENANNISELFYIRSITVDQLNDLETGEEEIAESKRVKKGDNTYTFVYKMSEDNPYEDMDLKAKFDRMKIDAKEMVKKYFKTF